MNHKLKFSIFLGVFFMAGFMALAGESLFTVVPWNGYKAAVSLTYDDGDPIHLSLAIPEMKSRNIKGTFFLTAGNILSPEEWKAAAAAGMEIGNHSMYHKHASGLTPENEIEEVDTAGEKLKELSGQPVMTYAYPFVEISDGLKARVEKNCIIARGGGPGNFYYTPDSEPDWYNIHSQGTVSDYSFETYRGWIDQAIDAGAWTVFLIHAIEGSDWYQPVPKDIFIKTLDYLRDKRGDVWIAPLGEIGAYWKAQKIIEGSKKIKTGNVYTLNWKKTVPFPAGVVVKLRIDGEGNTLTQAGIKIEQAAPGIYPVALDAGELKIELAKKPAK